MKTEDIFCKLFGFSKNTYYLWKRDKKPIMQLINKYLSNHDLIEFMDTGKIISLEVRHNYDQYLETDNIYKVIDTFSCFDEHEVMEYAGAHPFLTITARFVAYLSYYERNEINDFNSIDISTLFVEFTNQYQNDYISVVYRELKNITPNTIVALIEFSQHDFIDLYTNKNTKRYIDSEELEYFHIPYILFKYSNFKEDYSYQAIAYIFSQYFDGKYPDDINNKDFTLEEVLEILNNFKHDIINDTKKFKNIKSFIQKTKR